MAIRKIVKSGNTSYTITLPIEWLRANNLKAGDVIEISTTGLGNLLISGSSHQAQPPTATQFEIKIDDLDVEQIRLQLIIAYVQDAPSVILEGSSLPLKLNQITEALRQFIGFDIIEQNEKLLVIKNFFSLDQETTPNNLLKKIDLTNRVMFSLLHNFFAKKFVTEDVVEIKKLHNQNRRVFMLARKGILKINEAPQLLRDVQTTPASLLRHKTLLHFLINISSALVLLGENFLLLEANHQDVNKFKKIFNELSNSYEQVLVAFDNNQSTVLLRFLNNAKSYDGSIVKLLDIVHDPRVILCVTALRTINNNLKDIAYEGVL